MCGVMADPARENLPPRQNPAHSFVPPELPEPLLADCSSRRTGSISHGNFSDEADNQGLWSSSGASTPQRPDGFGHMINDQKRRKAELLEQQLQLEMAVVEQQASHRREQLRQELGIKAQQVIDRMGELLRREESSLDLELEGQKQALTARANVAKLEIEGKASGILLAAEAQKLHELKKKTEIPLPPPPPLAVPKMLNLAALQRPPTFLEAVAATPTEEIPTRIAEAEARALVEPDVIEEAKRYYRERVLAQFQGQRAQERLFGAMMTGHSDMPNLPLSAVCGWEPLRGGWMPSKALLRGPRAQRTGPPPTKTLITRRILRKVDPQPSSSGVSFEAQDARGLGLVASPLPSTAASSESGLSQEEQNHDQNQDQEEEQNQSLSFILREADNSSGRTNDASGCGEDSSLIGSLRAWEVSRSPVAEPLRAAAVPAA